MEAAHANIARPNPGLDPLPALEPVCIKGVLNERKQNKYHAPLKIQGEPIAPRAASNVSHPARSLLCTNERKQTRNICPQLSSWIGQYP